MSDEVKGRAKGGKARAEKLTASQREAIARKGVEAKKEIAALPKATHGSADRPLKIGDVEIPCYVLDDETRVLSQRGLIGGLGMVKGSTRSGDDQLTVLAKGFLEKSLISNELAVVIKNPIRFRPPHGGRPAFGYPATVLADLCEAVLAARAKGTLDRRQENLAKQCEILVRGFARVGIIALVDEATGYQKDRARDALAQILEKFVAREIQPYIKTFDASFYEHMFRLRGLPYPPERANYRPAYFGHLTNDIVYSRLAPGILAALKDEAKKEGTHMHRHLTPGVGRMALIKHLAMTEAYMRDSAQWADFIAKLNKYAPRYNQTLSLDLELGDR